MSPAGQSPQVSVKDHQEPGTPIIIEAVGFSLRVRKSKSESRLLKHTAHKSLPPFMETTPDIGHSTQTALVVIKVFIGLHCGTNPSSCPPESFPLMPPLFLSYGALVKASFVLKIPHFEVGIAFDVVPQ